MSSVAEYNFSITAGDTLDLTTRIKSDGVYVDITGYTARMHLRLRPTDANSTVDAVCVVTDALNGEIKCTLTKEETSDLIRLPASRTIYYYDLEVTSPGGKTTTDIGGKITVHIGATH